MYRLLCGVLLHILLGDGHLYRLLCGVLFHILRYGGHLYRSPCGGHLYRLWWGGHLYRLLCGVLLYRLRWGGHFYILRCGGHCTDCDVVGICTDWYEVGIFRMGILYVEELLICWRISVLPVLGATPLGPGSMASSQCWEPLHLDPAPWLVASIGSHSTWTQLHG